MEEERDAALQQLATPVTSVQAALARCLEAAKAISTGKSVPNLAGVSQLRVRTAADSIAAHLMAAEVAVNGAAPMPGLMYRCATAAGTLPRARGPVLGAGASSPAAAAVASASSTPQTSRTPQVLSAYIRRDNALPYKTAQ